MKKETMEKIRPGAKVKVWERVPADRQPGKAANKKGDEKEKERQSYFEGIVIARKHGTESGATFTVRADISGVGVEKIYPIHSPMITKVEIISSPKKTRRAKLYFIRNLSPKKIREKLGA